MTADTPHKNNSTQLYLFEDSIDERLAFIPMAVRFKLDLVGIKLHLNEWVDLTESTRRELLASPCNTPTELSDFAHIVTTAMVHQHHREPERFTPTLSPQWNDPHTVPEEITARTASLGLTFGHAQWFSLSPLERFVLLKLSTPKHPPQRLVPALTEFGVI